MFEEERGRRETSIRDFLRVVFRYKWVLVILFVVTTSVVALINVRSPVLYESEARVLVRRGQLENMVDARYRYLTWQEEVLSELETVKSQAVLDRARDILKLRLQEKGLERKPIIARGSVQADVVKESNVLSIAYLNRDPVYVVLVTDAIAEAYMQYRAMTYDVERLEEFFDSQIETAQMQMTETRSKMSEMVDAEGLTFSSDERHNFESKLNDTETELEEIKRKIELKEEILRAERQALEDGFITRIPRESGSSYGEISAILQHKVKLADLKSQRDAMAAQFTDKYPPLASLNSQIASLEDEIRGEVMNKIELDELDLRMLKSQQKDLGGTLLQTEAMLATLADKEGEYEQMQLDLVTIQDRYKELREAQIKTKLSQATSPAWRVTLITPASKPFARKTKDYVRMALTPLFSLIVGLGLIFFVESLDHSIKSAADAEDALGLPVLASLWEVKGKTF
jgi:succinoglycan biosynthesis transport protein ExoP